MILRQCVQFCCAKRKNMCNNHPTLHLVNINSYTKINFYQSIPKKLNMNTILTSIKCLTSVKKLKKQNGLYLDYINIDAYTKLRKIHQFIHKILSTNKNLTLIKGHNSVENYRKITCNCPNQDLIYTDRQKLPVN